tara:strand:- start:1053 stop:1196 length:144 start_codon:yes stop_codon:yes gene_type:complete
MVVPVWFGLLLLLLLLLLLCDWKRFPVDELLGLDRFVFFELLNETRF